MTYHNLSNVSSKPVNRSKKENVKLVIYIKQTLHFAITNLKLSRCNL